MDLQTKGDGEQKIVSDYEKVVLDEEKRTISINGFIIDDKDLQMLYEKNGLERIDFFRRVVKMGIVAIKSVSITEKTDFVDTQIGGIIDKFEKIVNDKLGDSGELVKMIVPLKEMFDIDNPGSDINKINCALDETIASKMNINDEKSPFNIVKRDLMNKMDNIKDAILLNIAESKGRKEERKKSTRKGFDFEDDVEEFLNKVAVPYRDDIKNVSKSWGIKGQKGDFVINIRDTNKYMKTGFIVEAKAAKMSIDSAIRYMNESLKNRPNMRHIIMVFQDNMAGKTGDINLGIKFIDTNKVICQFGDNGEYLEMAYLIIRNQLILEEQLY